MGKHASSGSSADPLVAAALAQRRVEGGAHRQEREPEGESPLGWPGQAPSPGGGGLGWPSGADAPEPGSAPVEGGQQPGDDRPGANPAPPAARRGWRRFFGQDPAA